MVMEFTTPLQYNMSLQLHEQHLLSDTEGAMSLPNAAAAVSFAAHHPLSCVFLHAVDLQIHTVLLQRAHDTHAHCLCGQASCHVANCSDLITHIHAKYVTPSAHHTPCHHV